VCTPGQATLAGLGHALAPAPATDPDAQSTPAAVEDPEAVLTLLRRRHERHGSVLVVVDHLEEVFTLNPRMSMCDLPICSGDWWGKVTRT
jgi:hypothetical protein